MSGLPIRIKELRKHKNLTQTDLGDMLGVGKTTISNYETGYSTPDSDTLIRLANMFEVSVDYLLGRSSYSQEDAKIRYKNFKRIPVYKALSVTQPIFDSKNIIDYIDLAQESDEGGDFFGMRMVGDSMDRARLYDGDTILVRKQETVKNGEIAVVFVSGEDIAVRRFYQNGRHVTLVPDSSDMSYEPRVYDVTRTEIRILGKIEKAIINF